MSLPHPRPTGLPSHIRSSSGFGALASASAQSTLLQTRIGEKKAELESLRQLRDLSAGLAAQMEQLEQKLATLNDGTEAVAAVLGNWHSVLRAIHMASVKVPKPKDDGETAEEETPLPQTLVRIPIHQAEAAQRDQEAAAAALETKAAGE